MIVSLCDVCEYIIYDEQCPYCGHDNSDQFSDDTKYPFIRKIIEKYWFLSEEELIELLRPIFGLSESRLRTILYESEEFPEGFEIE